MTYIYTTNDSRVVPIFIELYLVVGLASSIRELAVIVFQFIYTVADFVDYST
jgi:hypothetical protein